MLENEHIKCYTLDYKISSAIRVNNFSNTLFRNPVISGKKPNPVLRPTDGRGDAQYEVVTIDTTSHVPPSIPPPSQPTDGDVVYEQIH